MFEFIGNVILVVAFIAVLRHMSIHPTDEEKLEQQIKEDERMRNDPMWPF